MAPASKQTALKWTTTWEPTSGPTCWRTPLVTPPRPSWCTTKSWCQPTSTIEGLFWWCKTCTTTTFTLTTQESSSPCSEGGTRGRVRASAPIPRSASRISMIIRTHPLGWNRISWEVILSISPTCSWEQGSRLVSRSMLAVSPLSMMMASS